MNPRRLGTVAARIVLAGWIVVWLAGFGLASIENTGAAPLAQRRVPPLGMDAVLAVVPRANAMGNAVVGKADVARGAQSATGTATDATATSDEHESIASAVLADSSHVLPPETPPAQTEAASSPDPAPNEPNKAVSSIDVDECLAADACIDQYLWALYQRTPKEDSIKVQERRKVTVRKKGRMLTVTRSYTRLVDEDFTWKDPKAAKKAGMPMMDYVIGGMDRSFRLSLFHALRAAEQAGLSPGITSAFRDDYRQSLASGLKAAVDRSYHGGSFRGGYGHGLAADVVSVEGETRDQRWSSSEKLWKWIDAHGEEFGIGRPYLARDPAHVAPIDGQEYAAHHRETKTRHVASDTKRGNRLVARLRWQQ